MADDRRASRIPGFGVTSAAPCGAKPLESSKAANIAAGSKRKADGGSDAAPDAKRPSFSLGQGGPRPSRSNTTTGAAAGRTTSLQHATSARTAPGQLQPVSEVAPAAEETWEDIRDRTGQTADDVLNKKVSFPKGTKPERKVEAFVPMVKELKALGKHLIFTSGRLEMDVEQWKAHSEKLAADCDEKERMWNFQQVEMDKRIQEISGLLEQQDQVVNKLEADLKEANAKIVAKEDARAALQVQLDGVRIELDRSKQDLEAKNAKIKELTEIGEKTQKYATDLQSFNTDLHSQLTASKKERDNLQLSYANLQGEVAKLNGDLCSLQQRLNNDQEQAAKVREERDFAVRDVAMLRADLEDTRKQRERALAEASKAKEDMERIRAAGGKSLETMEALTNDKATMETQLSMQQKLIASMREDLAGAKESRAASDALADTRGAQIAELKAKVENLEGLLAGSERLVYEGELIRRKLHNIIQDLKGNIRVYCRVRPVSAAEAADAQHDSDMALDFPPAGDLPGRGITVSAPSGQSVQKHSFSFDRVFIPGTSQENVFLELAELVQSALDGHKVCIFAYGQTGSGKTYTMLGNRESPGVIPRAMQQIFESGQKLASQDWQFNMQASMLEIYNEDIRDLLSRKKDENKKHQVTHDANGVTTVTDLTVVDVNRTEAVEQLLAQAMDKRTVGCTQLNEQSSRSHMVFTMRIEGHNTATDAKVSGVLNLIDLAGSERVKESGATGQRLKEAQAINKSLSALGDVIMAIANKADHIPFRNSKLTYLLQPCLGGDSKTLMFLNVAPTREFASESLCSLRFGAKVNACEINVPKKNVVVPRG